MFNYGASEYWGKTNIPRKLISITKESVQVTLEVYKTLPKIQKRYLLVCVYNSKNEADKDKDDEES